MYRFHYMSSMLFCMCLHVSSFELNSKCTNAVSIGLMRSHFRSDFFIMYFSCISCFLDKKVKTSKHPDCYQQKVQKQTSMMLWRCGSAHGMGNLLYISVKVAPTVNGTVTAGCCRGSFVARWRHRDGTKAWHQLYIHTNFNTSCTWTLQAFSLLG